MSLNLVKNWPSSNFLSVVVAEVDWFQNSPNKKQPPEVFCKKRCPWKFRNIHRKTPVLESLFNKVAGLKAYNFIKKRLQQLY